MGQLRAFVVRSYKRRYNHVVSWSRQKKHKLAIWVIAYFLNHFLISFKVLKKTKMPKNMKHISLTRKWLDHKTIYNNSFLMRSMYGLSTEDEAFADITRQQFFFFFIMSYCLKVVTQYMFEYIYNTISITYLTVALLVLSYSTSPQKFLRLLLLYIASTFYWHLFTSLA